MARTMLDNVKFVNMLADGSTGTASTNEDTAGYVDMKGYEGVLFVIQTQSTQLQSNTLSVHAQEGATTATFLDLAGSTAYTTAAASTGQELILLDVNKPHDRYINLNIDGTAGGAQSVIAIQYGAHGVPIDQDSPTAIGLSNSLVNDNAQVTVVTPSTA